MQASNVKAMREALESALAVLDGFGYARPDCVRAAYDCKTALAAPPRQCDIGTAEEQAKRKMAFCYKQQGCDNCSLNKVATLTQCALAWAQMPYEEGENDGEVS